ncbi:hypothetical protein, partial [Streptomyces anulatus]|uniref:hypothetical protein n=1 Tax=Streptomyces anulatus TaxID=1892 RepID=UPI00367B67EE
ILECAARLFSGIPPIGGMPRRADLPGCTDGWQPRVPDRCARVASRTRATRAHEPEAEITNIDHIAARY